MLKYILLVTLGISQCYSMEISKDNITIEPIVNDKEELYKGLELSFRFFDKLYQTATLDEPQKSVIAKQKKNRLEELLSISGRKDFFVKKDNEVIGFLASHVAPNEPDRIIFDNAFLGDSENTLIVYESLLQHVRYVYSKVDKIWFSLLKLPETDTLAQKYGFKKSDYMDTVDPEEKDLWQGWEKPLN